MSGDTATPTAWRSLRALLTETVQSFRRHDLALYSAGVTFYAGIALVPSLLVAIRAAALLLGRDDIDRLSVSLSDALPDAIGAPEAARSLFAAGVALGPLTAIVSILPASLYGEGLRRAFVSLAGGGDSMTGWQGRLRVLPLFAVAPLFVAALLLVAPTLADLFDEGSPWDAVLGVYISLNLDWVLVSLLLVYAYSVVGQRRPGWRALLWGSFGMGAFIAGFVQGFVVFLAIPVDLGAPFGGLTEIGGVVAIAFWLWLMHILVLTGYMLTLRLDARGGSPFVDRRRPDSRGAYEFREPAPGTAPR